MNGVVSLGLLALFVMAVLLVAKAAVLLMRGAQKDVRDPHETVRVDPHAATRTKLRLGNQRDTKGAA